MADWIKIGKHRLDLDKITDYETDLPHTVRIHMVGRRIVSYSHPEKAREVLSFLDKHFGPEEVFNK